MSKYRPHTASAKTGVIGGLRSGGIWSGRESSMKRTSPAMHGGASWAALAVQELQVAAMFRKRRAAYRPDQEQSRRIGDAAARHMTVFYSVLPSARAGEICRGGIGEKLTGCNCLLPAV